MKIFVNIFLLFVSCFCTANVITVGATFPVKTIRQAFMLAHDGDTVMVTKGIYRETNLTLRKSIVLLGVGYPVLDGQHHYEVLSITAKNVVVRGLKIINSGRATLEDPCGIKVYESEGVSITDNILDNNFFGIYIQNSKKCKIKNNRIKASAQKEQMTGNGIHCWKSSEIEITGNIVSGHRDGIYLEFVTESVIWRNIAKHNIRYGLHFMFSHNDAYVANVFKYNGAGVAVMFTKNVKMFRNHFEENWGDSAYGLLLKEISDSYIFNNTFARNTTGIFMEGSSRIKIVKNIFSANGWGIKIQASCIDNEIINNNFLKNTFDCSTNSGLVLNTLHHNYWDKYEGYDLNKDGIGDVPYHPLSLFAILTDATPAAMLLYRSFMISLLDKSEKVLPSITPDNFSDPYPLMKSLPL